VEEVPLIGIISRLTDQKGFDILEGILSNLMRLKLELVILGNGEPKYHDLFSLAAKKYPRKLAVVLRFDVPLSRKIYAGSDFFLMPSLFEPCGLGQMISLRYATIPIVRETGGLADTIENFDPKTLEGNGFVFKEYSGGALLGAIKNALKIYKNTKLWQKLLNRALSYDFSWEASARQYLMLYKNLLKS
jgi:starch synthase